MLPLISFRLVFYFFLCLLFALELAALQLDSHYIFDIPICMLLLYLAYRFRYAIHLNHWHYFLFSLFLLSHCAGLYDAYLLYPFGIEYDYFVHGYFGLVASLIILRWMTLSYNAINYKVLVSFTVLFVLGISALHELYEFLGAVLLGKGEGVLFIGAGDLDPWDTQKDMLNNLFGALIGIVAAGLIKKL